MKRLLVFALMVAALVGVTALGSVAGCGDSGNTAADLGGPDLEITPQATHVGVGAVTCCLVTSGAELALYLSNPAPGQTDQYGRQHAAVGELHLVNSYGTDYKLADSVPAFGYGFTPDRRFAMFAQHKSGLHNDELDFASVSYPVTEKPQVKTVIPDGVQDFPLNQQSFFSPTGHFLIIGVLPGTIASSADLHVVDLRTLTDAAQLGKGAFNYAELLTPGDQMIFNNSTASGTPGVPSVQGMYELDLSLFTNSKFPPSLLDTHVSNEALMGDNTTLLYLKTDGSLNMLDLTHNFTVPPIGQNVIAYSSGPLPRGPIVWEGADGSLHFLQKLGLEFLSLPAHSADPFTPFVFSPDGSRLYWFNHMSGTNSAGDLYTMVLSNGQPHLLGTDVSTKDFYFQGARFLYIRNVDDTGTAGELVSANWDGSDLVIMGEEVTLGDLQTVSPRVPSGKHVHEGPIDLLPSVPPPIFANLTSAKRMVDSTNLAYQPINSSPSVVGALAFGPSMLGPEGVLNPTVHDGTWRFSDDGYILAYAGDATWDDTAMNWVGKLVLQPTVVDTRPLEPNLTGVAELGPVVKRQMFVSAPRNAKPGIYFIAF
jgi:hypothetical protein